MTTRTSSRRTSSTKDRAAGRDQVATALQEQLVEAVMQLTTSDGWTAMLDKLRQRAGSSMYRYSFNNTVMIQMQCPEASLVCSRTQWLAEHGRALKEGQKEKPVRIWAPTTARRAAAAPEESEQTGQQEATQETTGQGKARTPLRSASRFVLVPVYDVSQTEPEWQCHGRASYKITATLSVKSFHADIPGEAPAEMWRDLEAYATQQGYRVEFGETGDKGGWTDGETKTVRISNTATGAHAARVLAHEVGHIACGHMETSQDEYEEHQGRMEVEADSVAHMLCARYGLDAGVSVTPYLAEWAGFSPKRVKKMLIKTGETVRKAFGAVLESLEDCEAAQDGTAEVRELVAA
jgi:hypothetical protein